MDALNVFACLSGDQGTSDSVRPALITEGATWTFADLARGVSDLSRRFADKGIVPGARVALVASPTPEVFLAIHTLAALGATLVPIHPRLSATEVQTTLEVARATFVLAIPDIALPPHFAPRVPLIDALRDSSAGDSSAGDSSAGDSSAGDASARDLDARDGHSGDPRTRDSHSRDTHTRDSHSRDSDARDTASQNSASRNTVSPLQLPPFPRSAHDAPFAIVSTSGTTGRPKGAVLSRSAILAAAAASAHNLGWQEDDRWLLCMPLAHVGGLSIVTRCLVARRAVVLLPRFEPALVLEAIRRHRVTLMSVVPAMMHALLEADTTGTLAQPRAILLGGAASSPALLEACASRGIRALTTYGLTETCSQVTCQSPRDPSIRLAGSGPPLPGFDLRIAADDGSPLPPGQIGHILVRGPALFDGYLTGDEPPLTDSPTGEEPPLASNLTSDEPPLAGDLTGDKPPLAGSPAGDDTPLPRRSREAFFDTGDLGELDLTGHLHIHARRTDLIVTGGENVYPAEVEQALERYPGVRRALVFGVPDDRWGQIVAAALEVDPASPPQTATLTNWLSTTLAPHKRPRKWAFVAQLPLTPSGKLARNDAPTHFAPLLHPL